jgi:hypothetical protein
MKKVGHEEALPAADGEEVDGGSRRCSTQWRFSGVEGRRPEVVVDGSGGGSARPSGERSG